MDDIASQIKKVIEVARESGCVIVRGTVESSGLTVVDLDGEAPNEACDSLIEALRATRPAILVVNLEHLEEHEVDDAIAVAESAEGADEEQRTKVLSELARCRERVGETTSAQLWFMASPTLQMKLTLYAPWNEVVYGTEEELGYDDDDGYSDTLSEAKLNEMSRMLAEHARFQRATTKDARMSAARDLLEGDKSLPSDHLEEIVSAAKGILDIEIRPAREQELRDAAQVLLKSGKSKGQVAGELKMTLGNLKKLLG